MNKMMNELIYLSYLWLTFVVLKQKRGFQREMSRNECHISTESDTKVIIFVFGFVAITKVKRNISCEKSLVNSTNYQNLVIIFSENLFIFQVVATNALHFQKP